MKTEEETFENSKNSKGILRKIGNIIFWVVIIGLFAIWTTDFIRTKKDEKPIFCVKTVEHKYDDGNATECIGLGYKVINYNRSSIKTKNQFAPFFVGMEE